MKLWGGIGRIFIFLVLPLFATYIPSPTREEIIEKYVAYTSDSYGLDPLLCLAVMYTENPELDELAVNINRNGTSDVGLFQLNDRYIREDFIWRYWGGAEDFDPMNYEQNTVIAIKHLVALQSQFDSEESVVIAYNCGASAVKSGRIPKSTKSYYKKYKLNYNKLKGGAK